MSAHLQLPLDLGDVGLRRRIHPLDMTIEERMAHTRRFLEYPAGTVSRPRQKTPEERDADARVTGLAGTADLAPQVWPAARFSP